MLNMALNINSQDENSAGVQIKSSGAIAINGASGASDTVSLLRGYKTSASGDLTSVFNVNVGGDITAAGVVEIGAGYENISIEPGVNAKLTIASAEDQPDSDDNAIAFQLRKYPTKGVSVGAYNAFQVRNNGSISASGYFWSQNTDSVQGGCYLYNYDGNAARNGIAFQISPTISSNQKTVDINYDGSATFAGGDFTVASTGDTRCKGGDAWTLGSSGNANFNGTVTSQNSLFNLDPNNSANYNSSGEYTGATLDVKDRLQKSDAALTAIKAAVSDSNTDLAGLKAAILTALSNH